MLVVSGEFAKTIETGTCPTAELVFVIVPLGGGAGRAGRKEAGKTKTHLVVHQQG